METEMLFIWILVQWHNSKWYKNSECIGTLITPTGTTVGVFAGESMTSMGSVDINVYNSNVRRDKNVALFHHNMLSLVGNLQHHRLIHISHSLIT